MQGAIRTGKEEATGREGRRGLGGENKGEMQRCWSEESMWKTLDSHKFEAREGHKGNHPQQ